MNKMKRKSIFSKIAVCAVSMTMLASATACGKPDNVGGNIAVICKNEKVSFWDEVKIGAQDCCDEMGYDMLYYCASGDNDYASQIEYVNDAIDKGVKAIVIAPNDPSELNGAFAKATEKGIKIVNINSRSEYGNIESCVSSSDFDGGAVAARNAMQLLFASIAESNTPIGKIAMIGHTASTAELRLTGFKATVSPLLGQYMAKQAAAQAAAQGAAQGAAENAGGPPAGADTSAGGPPAGADTSAEGGSKSMSDDEKQSMLANYFIDGQRCGTQEAAYEEAKKLLQENSDISIMYATNTNTTLGVCQAIEELDKANDVIVVGFNSDEQELKYVRTGVLDGTIIQNPYSMGYIGTRYAILASQGDGVAGSVDTGVTWISAKNINDDDIQLLLYPERT
jgi:ABC-type sugar transport system substrate-binding protein